MSVSFEVFLEMLFGKLVSWNFVWSVLVGLTKASILATPPVRGTVIAYARYIGKA